MGIYFEAIIVLDQTGGEREDRDRERGKERMGDQGKKE